MSAMLKVFIFLAQLTLIFSELLPMEKCKLSDASCLKTSVQTALPTFVAGLKEIGVDTLDPMKIKTINIKWAGLNMKLTSINIKGLNKSQINSFSIDMAKKQIIVDWDTDILMQGHYVASGKLMVLPITGDGELTLKINKIRTKMTIDFVISKDANGKDIIDFQSEDFTFKIKDSVHVDLTNLFNGNKQLSDSMLNFINSNWRTIVEEFGRPMLEVPLKKIYGAMKKYLKSQPIEDISKN